MKPTNLGEREKGSLFYLVDLLLQKNIKFEMLDNFYYSYTIPHIGKEFDLLKIDDEIILNIEQNNFSRLIFQSFHKMD